MLYIGQTTRQKIQKRFEGHGAVIKILATYVNDPESKVYVKLCSRLDVSYEKSGTFYTIAVEQLPLNQAQHVINDGEAYLIYRTKPFFNSHYKKNEKSYWKEFYIETIRNITI